MLVVTKRSSLLRHEKFKNTDNWLKIIKMSLTNVKLGQKCGVTLSIMTHTINGDTRHNDS
jgi:hypothetical protein